MRDFTKWLKTMRDSIATYSYYTDFTKVFDNVSQVKVELNILNSLIGSNNIKNDFITLVNKYKEVLKVIPILLAKRESEIKVTDLNQEKLYNFKILNYSIEEYAYFMEKTGIFNLIQNHIINNLVDYVTGVEVGMDTNTRKNRTGDVMEDLIESYLQKAGFIKDKTYFKEMKKSDIEKMFSINLDSISNNGKTEKRFDFVFIKNDVIYAAECNFYSGGGSKLNETARSYKNLALEAKTIPNFKFVWFTDGKGWESAKHNLEETFDVLETIYNLNDLENNALDELFNK